MELHNILQKLIDLLEEERKILITSLKDNNSEKLLEIIKKKQKILDTLSSIDQAELNNFKKELQQISELNKRNLELTQSNMKFIEHLFEAIFEDEKVKKYSPDGTIQNKKEGLFNKKI